MYENIMRSASSRLNLCLLTAILLTALPLAAHAQNVENPQALLATCSMRHNRADFDGGCKTDISAPPRDSD